MAVLGHPQPRAYSNDTRSPTGAVQCARGGRRTNGTGGARRARVLGERAGRGRDLAGVGARARSGRRLWCGRCTPASAAGPRRWCSGAACPKPVRR